MTEKADPVTASSVRTAGRVERVLDAAADLLVRWGYQRVTIEDVARHAGIGKGTVYLHFATKDALFLTVLLRTHRGIATAATERMAADPLEVLPSRMLRALHLGLAADPVTRVLYLGDGEVLGRLAHEATATLGELSERRQVVLREQLRLLRDAGCLRTDLSVDDQLYVLSAVASGFYFVDGLPIAPADASERADLLAHALAAALEVPDPPAAAAADVASAIAEGYRWLITLIDDEWQRRVR